MQPTGDNIIVLPHYDSGKVGSIDIPDSATNPQSQQGEVLAVGPNQSTIEVGDHVMYEPYKGTPFTPEDVEYLLVPAETVIGWLAPDGEAFPLPDAVMVIPDWEDHQVLTAEITELAAQQPNPQRFIDELTRMVDNSNYWQQNPRTVGRCVRRGDDVTTVLPNDRVFFHTGAGHEVGVQTTVYYFIKEKDILAKCSG